MVKGYRLALNHVFILSGMDIASDTVISCMFSSYERSCPPGEMRPPELNVSLALRSLTHPPYELLKLSSDKHMTWKTCFLLALASAKGVSMLHGLTYWMHYSKGWRSHTFLFLPDFIAKTQNASVHDLCFEELTVPSLADFLDENRDEMLRCHVRAVKRYLSRTEQFRPECSGLFISLDKRNKPLSQNTISFWIRSVISHAYQSATDENSRTVKVKAHEVQKVGTSLLFSSKRTVQSTMH